MYNFECGPKQGPVATGITADGGLGIRSAQMLASSVFLAVAVIPYIMAS